MAAGTAKTCSARSPVSTVCACASCSTVTASPCNQRATLFIQRCTGTCHQQHTPATGLPTDCWRPWGLQRVACLRWDQRKEGRRRRHLRLWGRQREGVHRRRLRLWGQQREGVHLHWVGGAQQRTRWGLILRPVPCIQAWDCRSAGSCIPCAPAACCCW